MGDIVYVHVAVVAGAILLDMVLGDPPNRYHPTAWVGRVAAYMIPVRGGRAWGVVVCVVLCMLAGICAALPYYLVWYGEAPALLVYCVAAILLLKSTIALRGLRVYAVEVTRQLEDCNAPAAASRLARIVKRPTGKMDRAAMCSATIESVAENTTDGVTGPLFYMGCLGLAGSFVYRTVNTMDAMAGYKTDMLRDVGWFGAHADTVLNWVPARLTGCMMVLAAAILGYDAARALNVMLRDARKPSSKNSGYTMAAVAGALNIRLQKPGHYTLGGGRDPGVSDVYHALRISKCASWLFAGMVVVPLVCGVWLVWEALV